MIGSPPASRAAAGADQGGSLMPWLSGLRVTLAVTVTLTLAAGLCGLTAGLDGGGLLDPLADACQGLETSAQFDRERGAVLAVIAGKNEVASEVLDGRLTLLEA